MIKKLLILFIITSTIISISAVGWHNANNILPGTFQPGNFNFIGNVNITENIILKDKEISNDNGMLNFDGENITPTGMVVAFDLATCPSGWILANGLSNTPDLRGIFIRGAGASGSYKKANTAYYSQTYDTFSNDKFQGHEHSQKTYITNGGSGSAHGAIYSASSMQTPIFQIGAATNDGTNGAPRISTETAPAAYALTYCVKEAGSDYAEWIESSEIIKEGMIVSVDKNNDNKVTKSKGNNDNNIIGIVSTQPGWIIGKESKTTVKLALVGQVPVKVTLENGEIKRGDAITSSSLEGFGMKANNDDRIVGIALTELNNNSNNYNCGENKCGSVKVLLDLSWKNNNEEIKKELLNLKKENQEIKKTNSKLKEAICEINPNISICIN